jgi:hypothetical protein
MLKGTSAKADQMFREEIDRVLEDPIGNASLWHWADGYAEDSTEATEKIVAAGLDPLTLGRPIPED